MMAEENRQNGVSAEDLIRHVLGDTDGYFVTWTKVPGAPPGEGIKQSYWKYPEALQEALSHARDESTTGHDAYYGVSLFKRDGTRRAEDALDFIDHLWMDSDSYKGRRPEGFPDPTAYAISSPGSYHEYWKLTRPIPKERAVELNRRLALWAGMDKHLAAITTILRVPGTKNYKRDEPHEVTAEITGVEPYDPDELEALLPPEPKPEPKAEYDGPEDAGFDLEDWLERHPEARDAIHGEGSDNQSRVKYEITCPWVEEHTTGDNGTYIGQYPDGALWFKCNHGHGEGLGWREYRRFYEGEDYEVELLEGELGDIHETVGVPQVSRECPDLPSHTVPPVVSGDDPCARARRGIFPVEVLPPVLRQMTEEVAEEMNVPPEYFVSPALATLASAIGGTRYLNVFGSYDVIANLSSATIAYSSDKKTPPYNAATAPAKKLERQLQGEYTRAKGVYELELETWEADKKEARKAGRTPRSKPIEPVLKTAMASNFTPESLTDILNSNPRGVLVADDELSGFFRGMDRYKAGGGGNERQFHLKVMTNDTFPIHRVGKGPAFVHNPVASYTGNIQPDMLPAFLIPKPGGRKGDADDGMLHRWLFVWPPQVETVDSLERSNFISSGTKLQYEFLYKKLRDLDFDEAGEPLRISFTSEAFKKFNRESYMEWQRRSRHPGVPQLLRSAYGKMAAHTARIALVFALCRNPDENTGEIVTVEDVDAAIAVVEYFALQAKKVHNALRRTKEGKEERTLRVLNSLLDTYGDRWKIATATLHVLMQEHGAYDVAERTTEFTKELAALADKTPGITVETNKRVGAENDRGVEIIRDAPAVVSSAPAAREITVGTVQDGSSGHSEDTSGTLEEPANGLDTGELILFALDRLGRAYPEDLATATGRKLKTVKNALTELRKAAKVEYTGEKRNQAQEVRLVPNVEFDDEDGGWSDGKYVQKLGKFN